MTVQIYPPSRTVDQHRVRPALASQPPLYAGDRLSRVEFERRYHAHPEIKKAELVEGIVYMPSPARFSQHSQPQADVITWLGMYRSVTPGVMVGDNATLRALHRTIKKVTEDVEGLSFNTAISTMMVFVNHLGSLPAVPKVAAENLALLLSPFAPHVAEEIWSKLGHEDLASLAQWPAFDPKLTVEDTIEIGVQVNGKVRGRVMLSRTASEDDAKAAALAAEGVGAFVDGKSIKKFVYVPGRIVNLVVG